MAFSIGFKVHFVTIFVAIKSWIFLAIIQNPESGIFSIIFDRPEFFFDIF